ncbi:hypothetical protein FQN50_009945 [Emmonsiellopsis sp. PD_5]|nr:hypothetical protein FQN50_009945 [Emmonsiellopsis sp. PD_5]
MLINEKTAITSSRVLLVPYSKHHVPRYHEWMQDAKPQEIQQATASEPLSLPEEYAMQSSWRTDADKLTFIICVPLAVSAPSLAERVITNINTTTSSTTSTPITLEDPNVDAPAAMLGDVNLFLRVDEDDGDEDVGEGDGEGSTKAVVVGEIELMIAEKGNQGKGYGRAGLLCFLKYVADNEGGIVRGFMASLSSSSSFSSSAAGGDRLGYLVAKIGAENTRSLALFESVGFQRISEKPNVFGEVELRREMVRGEEGGELLGRFGVEGYREVGYER